MTSRTIKKAPSEQYMSADGADGIHSKTLSSTQLNAVITSFIHDDQNELTILGPPGTGKTRTLLRHYAELESLNPGNSLIISFSKAGANAAYGQTVHSLAYQLLHHPNLAESDEAIKLWNQQYPEISIAQNQDFSNEHIGSQLLGAYNLARLNSAPLHGTLKTFAQKWQDFKYQTQSLDFTDLIQQALDTELGNTPQVIFVDEAQDLTPWELQLIRHWAENSKIIWAGDDDQSIYTWRGANPHGFLAPNHLTLAQSYRIPQNIHSISQSWIKQIKERQPKIYFPTSETGKIRGIPDASWQQPLPVIQEIAHDPKNKMLLAPIKKMLSPSIHLLQDLGVPYHNPYSENPLYNPMNTMIANLVRAILTNRWRGKDLNTLSTLTKIKLPQYAQNVIVPKNLLPPELLNQDPLWLWPHLNTTQRTNFTYLMKVKNRYGPEALNPKNALIIGTIHSVKGGEANTVFLFPSSSLLTRREDTARIFYVAITRTINTLAICAPQGWNPLGGI